MKSYRNYVRSFFLFLSSILTGLCILIAVSVYVLNSGILNPGFHKNLFHKYEIGAQTYQAVNSSLMNIVGNLKENTPEAYSQNKSMLTLLESTLSQDMINRNIDPLLTGFFDYLKGKKIFLPDIYLYRDAGMQTEESNHSNLASMVFSKIDRINLSAVFLYMNKSNLYEWLSKIKLFIFLLDPALIYSLFAIILMLLLSVYLSKNVKDVARWLGRCIKISALLLLGTSTGLFISNYTILPIAADSFKLPLQQSGSILMRYLQDCINYSSVYLLIFGLVFFLLSLIPYLSKRYRLNLQLISKHWKVPDIFTNQKNLILLKRSSIVLLTLITVVFIVIYTIHFKKDFDTKGMNHVISNIVSQR